MNLKSSIKYQLYDTKNAVIIFYGVVLTVTAALIILTTGIVNISSNGSSNSVEVASAIFLFIAGLVSFKETFGMLIQNGVSRKTMFFSSIITQIVVCFGMAVIDRVILLISKLLNNMDKFEINGMFELIYSEHWENISDLQNQAENFLLNFLSYLAVFAIGYFITIAYYRMNNALKVAVSVGVPVSIIIVLPILDNTFFNGAIMSTIFKIIGNAFGLFTFIPYPAMLSFFIIFSVLSILSWLLIRRAVVK